MRRCETCRDLEAVHPEGGPCRASGCYCLRFRPLPSLEAPRRGDYCPDCGAPRAVEDFCAECDGRARRDARLARHPDALAVVQQQGVLLALVEVRRRARELTRQTETPKGGA